MDVPRPTLAEQIERAALASQAERTGHKPKSATVVVGKDTIVVTLHEALTPAERALARTPEGAAQLQEFHRQLFSSSNEGLRLQIERITGAAVRAAAAEIEPESGAVVHTLECGTMVQVFFLTDIDSKNGNGRTNDEDRAENSIE